MDLSQSTPPQLCRRSCPVCGQSYPRTPEFWFRDKAKYDGLYGICKLCCRVADRRRRRCARERDPLRARADDVVKRRRLRVLVLSHYSGGSPCCACCGVSQIEFLAIDHINGRGRVERGRLGRYGDSLY